MQTFRWLQVGLILIGTIILSLSLGLRPALSYFSGSSIVLLNVSLLAWTFDRILKKKLVAVSIFVIVFKYAILGVILYFLLRQEWFEILWFCLGLGTLSVASLGTSLLDQEQKSEAEPMDPSPEKA